MDRNIYNGDYEEVNNIVIEILKTITNGEFPNKTFNHIMAGEFVDLENAKELFNEEGQIMQQVFSFEAFRKGFYGRRKEFKLYSFNDNNEKGDLYDKLKNSGFDSELLAEEILQSDNYILSNSGISVLGGDVWKFQSVCRSPLFGFGKNKAFIDYINKYESILGKTNMDDNSKEYTLERISKIQSNSLNGWAGDGVAHPSIPFIVNHPYVPNLRWCHADYAAFETDQGYAILEMFTDEIKK